MAQINRYQSSLFAFLKIMAVFIAGMTLFRAALTFTYRSRIAEQLDTLNIFAYGLRFDLVIVCYLMAIPLLLSFMLKPSVFQKFKPSLVTYFTFFAAVIAFVEIATFPFLNEYDLRPNRLAFEYILHPQEIINTIIASEKLAIFAAMVIVGIIWFGGRKFFERALSFKPSEWSLRHFAGLCILLLFIAFGIRGGSLTGRPVTPSDAAFSNDHLVNELALNSPYTLGSALYSLRFEAADLPQLSAPISLSQAVDEVIATSTFDKKSIVPDHNPMMHLTPPRVTRKRPANFVIILEESLGAEYVGVLGGRPLTPHFDALSKKGLLFTNLFATGTRSARGIEAILSGYLPTAGKSTIKLGLSQKNFFTIGAGLKPYGYQSSFIYGGDSAFDNMRMFSLNNGIDQVIDERDYPNCSFKGIWGCSDEDLFAKAIELFKSQGDKPFFSLVFTSSNHGPFQYPEGKIELYENPKDTVHNAIKYADYALGKFFENAEKESFYKDTVFVVVADHNWKTFGEDLVPVDKMRIPGLIIGPGFTPGIHDKVASQIDIAPTVFPALGVAIKHPMVGHDVLSLPQDHPGRAVLQFGDYNAYKYGDDVVIHRLGQSPLQFKHERGRLHRSELNSALERTAAAYAVLPSLLYTQRLYSH